MTTEELQLIIDVIEAIERLDNSEWLVSGKLTVEYVDPNDGPYGIICRMDEEDATSGWCWKTEE